MNTVRTEPRPPADVRVGVAIMHHPRRAELVEELRRSCEPLVARVVVDPDPDGIPSPLRTAKRAWAAIDEGVTHHLVLQDDIRVADGFAAHVHAAVTQHPDAALAFYSHWDSPQNSYLVRRAAIAGSPWAPLSRREWTPTQALVLPVAYARDLARFLAGVPDEIRDDDEMVVIFCRERGIPVLATVPHLVDHRADETIVGHHGTFHATIFLPDLPPAAESWRPFPALERALAARADAIDEMPYAVEFTRSQCRLRFFRPAAGEPVEHHFGWYWRDWCALVGIDVDEVTRDCAVYVAGQIGRPHLRQVPRPLIVEVWAAGYLLGADVARTVATPGTAGMAAASRSEVSRAAIATWVRSGLAPHDRALLDDALSGALVDLGVSAVAAAWVNQFRPPP